MYLILFTPLVAGLIAQTVKFFIRSNEQKISFKNFIAYSGMPSAHSAMVVSLAAILGLKEGFNSSLFALGLVLAIIVVRDAVGIRKYLGQHGKVLNVLVRDLEEDKMLDKSYPHLLEKIGHTPMQVLVGSLIGLAVATMGFYLF